MKYIKKFLEHNTPLYDDNWQKHLPKELFLITHNGKFKFIPDTDSQYHTVVDHITTQIIYKNITEEEKIKDPNKVLEDGEPDSLEIDLRFFKDNDGTSGNAKKLKINVDITYGDAMMVEFTISPPNKIKMGHYTSVHSKYDAKTMFAFSDDSIKKLVDFFNKFSNEYKLTIDDFKFLDSDPNSYIPDYDNNRNTYPRK